MDEVPMTFDAPMTRTVTEKGGIDGDNNYHGPRENQLHRGSCMYGERKEAEADVNLQEVDYAQGEDTFWRRDRV